MKLVVDASVAVKWVIPTPEVEPDSDLAANLLVAIRAGAVEILQPPHWMAEVAAVVARMRPETASEAIDLLDSLDVATAADPDIYKRASRIAAEVRQHLFDTLYHAVALEREAVLITADDRYLRRARRVGNAIPLSEWRPPKAAGG